jgi:AraC-like DNA-binding protein
MLFEPTTLTSAARTIAETLEKQYAIDPAPLFETAELDIEDLSVAGARYPWLKMQHLWKLAVQETGDPCFGLYVARRVRPTSFHALGYSWLASQTLHGSLQRFCRYYHLITTAPLHLGLEERNNQYVFSGVLGDSRLVTADASTDAFLACVLQLCRAATDSSFAPTAVTLQHEGSDHVDEYIRFFDAPVTFSAERNAMFFEKAALETILPGDNSELAKANDKVAEHYLESLEPRKVASEVRELLVTLLPSGHSNQDLIAQRLHRSVSTLQRQLTSEGTNYQEVRDATRQALAEEYVADHKLTLSQVAYMLGFSDQSNFSRAFKRWTGSSPREYQA